MEDLFSSIINEQLSSVEFVQNYLQLRFDGPCLTCYAWPSVVTESQIYTINNEGYRDALCRVITHRVERVLFIENNILTLIFDGGYQISLSLARDESNSDLVEFAYFHGIDKEWFVLD